MSVTFDQFNASFWNESINFLQLKILQAPNFLKCSV